MSFTTEEWFQPNLKNIEGDPRCSSLTMWKQVDYTSDMEVQVSNVLLVD